MARIAFTSQIADIVGKLAGSVFQYSYGGFQVHSRVVPANPQTNRQQLRRGWFGWFAALWRTLTPVEQATFIAAAGTAPGAFRLFVGSNINLFLIDEPMVSSYAASAPVPDFTLDILQFDSTAFEVIASGVLTVVPAGYTLLLFATNEKPLSRIFTNPSEFSPITYFPALTDLSVATDVLADWIALYGQVVGSQRICINSVLIDTSNGARGADNITCLPPAPSTTERIMDADGTFITDYDGVYVVQQ